MIIFQNWIIENCDTHGHWVYSTSWRWDHGVLYESKYLETPGSLGTTQVQLFPGLSTKKQQHLLLVDFEMVKVLGHRWQKTSRSGHMVPGKQALGDEQQEEKKGAKPQSTRFCMWIVAFWSSFPEAHRKHDCSKASSFGDTAEKNKVQGTLYSILKGLSYWKTWLNFIVLADFYVFVFWF